MKREEIEHLLPEVFRRTSREGSPLWALLEVMERLHEPDEEVLSELDRHFSPDRCGDERVPYLAGWVDLGWLFRQPGGPADASGRPFPAGTAQLRQLVVRSHELSRWRGTSKGLLLFLELATGLTGFAIDERPIDGEGVPRPFHIRVFAPSEAKPLEHLVERILEHERPVSLTYELVFGANGSTLSAEAPPLEAGMKPKSKQSGE